LAGYTDAYHKSYDNCDLSDIDVSLAHPVQDFVSDRLYDLWVRSAYTYDCSNGNRHTYSDSTGEIIAAQSPFIIANYSIASSNRTLIPIHSLEIGRGRSELRS